MKYSTEQSSKKSREKRDPGYVKLRRGLLPHLSKMSSNASKLYVCLLLKAHWKSGPKRGLAEVSYEDIACDLGWSYSTVRRTIGELTRKAYIEVTPAANQYELTRIKIFKYDPEEGDSAVFTGEHTKPLENSAVLSGVFSAASTGERSGERSNTPISQSERDLQAPKKVKKYRSKEDYNPPTPLKGECDGFEQFWLVYPKKISKQKAVRAWRKIKGTEIVAILTSVETWNKTEQWRREGGRFIPYPATFLNDRRWEDAVPEALRVLHSEGGGKFDDVPVY